VVSADLMERRARPRLGLLSIAAEAFVSEAQRPLGLRTWCAGHCSEVVQGAPSRAVGA